MMIGSRSRGALTRSDRGAGFVEYAGVVLTIGVIVVALLATGFTQSSNQIVASIKDSVCEAFNFVGLESECNNRQRLADEEYEPDKCLVSKNTDIGGGSISVLFVDVGQDYAFIKEEFSDGTTKITLVDGDMVGVSTGAGVSVDLGGSSKIGAEVDVGAGMTLENGSSWVFDSPAEAKAMEDELAKFQKVDALSKNTVGQIPLIGGWAREQTNNLIGPDIPDPDITRTTLGTEAGVDGYLGLKFGSKKPDRGGQDGDKDNGWGLNPNLGLDGAIQVQAAMGEERNRKTGETTTIYEIGGSASIAADGQVKKGTAGIDRTGAIKITEDEKGNITKLELTQVKDDGVGMAPVITTTEIDVESAEEGEMVKEWMGMFADDNVIPLTWDAADPTELSENPTPFEEWVFENGKTTRASYDGEDNTHKVGAEVKLGLKFGFGGTWGGTSQDISEAEYLGAPNNGSREYVPYEACSKDD
ncbi:hypothetical protein HNR23_000699 [Nocardiopsis mwathae]|uniref:Uncharacterized protein n=1 Tax=Nocardiopsis mwathae TaxID=1472723 RepID=A0A7W9YEK1_9ACTN|nr:hypothetical protein [Nocardiopsis mwathae]MBB6170639.1 hypothetical protein [Nocardiopsis mwathae]